MVTWTLLLITLAVWPAELIIRLYKFRCRSRYLVVYFVAVILGAHLDELAIDSLEDIEDVAHQCRLAHVTCTDIRSETQFVLTVKQLLNNMFWGTQPLTLCLWKQLLLWQKQNIHDIVVRLLSAGHTGTKPFWVHTGHSPAASPSRRGRTTLVEGAGGPSRGRVVGGARAEDGEALTGSVQASREPRDWAAPAADWGGWLKNTHPRTYWCCKHQTFILMSLYIFVHDMQVFCPDSSITTSV